MDFIDATVPLLNVNVDHEGVAADEVAPRVQEEGGFRVFHEGSPRQASYGQIARGSDHVGEGGWRDAHGWVHRRRVQKEWRGERVNWKQRETKALKKGVVCVTR